MKHIVPDIDLQDFQYHLPEDKIAKYPLDQRSQSKLLFYEKGAISHYRFKDIDQLIPDRATLFFNDTKVIPARLHFYKETGALIEIFLLEPQWPTHEVASAMLVKKQCNWKCMIGNLKKWKEDTLKLDITDEVCISARLLDRENQRVEFCWNGDHTFVELLELAGKIPLPPYLGREDDDLDKERYQTVYSKQEGAVAAPTAGLHFDNTILSRLSNRAINTDYLTLHVSAGTFQPIKSAVITAHPMHHEQVIVSKKNVENILNSECIIAVGTTSMRTLESLYWFGADLLLKNKKEFNIHKLRPYEKAATLPDLESVAQAILEYMDHNHLETLTGNTEIFIFPGYRFQVCKGLITNYHLPGSTLILLIAAFIGEDWRQVYEEALKGDYRFLSYGDSSLLLPK